MSAPLARLTRDDVQKLGKNPELVFVSASGGDYFCKAKVKVIGAGESACLVRVTEILKKGLLNMTIVDETFPAEYVELQLAE